MGRVFNGTTPNLNWAVNRLNNQTGIIEGILGSIQGGGGAVAPNAQVEAAVQWAINKVSNNYITYSQTNRNLNKPNATSYDCSSFIITAFNVAGFNVSATYTRDMRAGFERIGFVWHEADNGRIPASICQRGDILLNETHHTQMYIGNNKDVNCGSTPARIKNHTEYYNYGGASGWDGWLRYNG